MPDRATLDHLAALYAADPDPWGHARRGYERAKHARTMQAVGPGPFRSAVEVGCGIGPLTGRLALLCERLVAIDCVAAALWTARARVPCRNVTFVEAVAPAGLPEVAVDLVVLSEVLYFLEASDIDGVAGWLDRRAVPGCRVVSVNWTGPTGHALTGRDAADRLIGCLADWRAVREDREGYMLDTIDRSRS